MVAELLYARSSRTYVGRFMSGYLLRYTMNTTYVKLLIMLEGKFHMDAPHLCVVVCTMRWLMGY